MYKVVYGRDAIGWYAYLYKRFLFIYWPVASVNSTGFCDDIAQQWKSQYNVPDSRFIKKNI